MKWWDPIRSRWQSIDKNTRWMILAGLAGILLLVLPGLWQPQKEESPLKNEPDAWAAYAQTIEERMTDMVESTAGAGRAKVMVTFETSAEKVYALDEKSSADSYTGAHVLLEDGSALVEYTWVPSVQGVAILCEGAQNAALRTQLVEMAQVLLGVSSNRVSIADYQP